MVSSCVPPSVGRTTVGDSQYSLPPARSYFVLAVQMRRGSARSAPLFQELRISWPSWRDRLEEALHSVTVARAGTIKPAEAACQPRIPATQ